MVEPRPQDDEWLHPGVDVLASQRLVELRGSEAGAASQFTVLVAIVRIFAPTDGEQPALDSNESVEILALEEKHARRANQDVVDIAPGGRDVVDERPAPLEQRTDCPRRRSLAVGTEPPPPDMSGW